MIGDLSKARDKAFRKFKQKYYPGVKDVTDPTQVFCSHWVGLAFQEYYKKEFFEEECKKGSDKQK